MTGVPLPDEAPRPRPGDAEGLDEADDRYLDDLAARVRGAGLGSAALLWLGSLRPLSFLGAQSLHLAAPLLDVFVPDDGTARLATLLEDRRAWDRFLDHLDRSGAPGREAAGP